jgi:Zn-dependent protease
LSRTRTELSFVALAALAVAAQGGMLNYLGPLGLALVVAFVVISLSVHEAAHAMVADLRGDSTAREMGRLTLNPLPHIDPFMTVLLPVATMLMGGVFIGGAKPVPVSFHRLRSPFRDMMLVALAGPASNFLLAVVFLLAYKLSIYVGHYPKDALLPKVMESAAYWNLFLAVFNLLPIPPLDGSRVMAWLLPSSMRDGYIQLERFGLFLLLAVILFVPGVTRMVQDGVNSTYHTLFRLTGGAW